MAAMQTDTLAAVVMATITLATGSDESCRLSNGQHGNANSASNNGRRHSFSAGTVVMRNDLVKPVRTSLIKPVFEFNLTRLIVDFLHLYNDLH